MTKIVIALCILSAIASTGGQGFSIAPMIIQPLQIFLELAKALQSGMEESFIAMANSAETLASETIGNMQTIVVDWEEKLLKLPGGIDVVRSCTTSSVDLRRISKALISNVTNCIGNSAYDIKASYLSVSTRISNFVEELNNDLSQADACQTSQALECISIVFSIFSKLTSNVASNWASLSTDSSALINKMASFAVTAQVCAVAKTAETLAITSAESAAYIAQCVADKALDGSLLSI